MSGPKCATYHIEPDRNELLRQARLADVRRAAQSATARLQAAMTSARRAESQHGIRIEEAHLPMSGGPRFEASVEELEEYVAKIEGTATQISAAQDRAEGIVRLRSLIATSSDPGQVVDWSSDLDARAAKQSPAPQSTHSPEMKNRKARLEQIAERLVGGVSLTERAEIQAIVQAILSTHESHRADSLETQLRLRIQQANERIQRAWRDSADAARLVVELRGLEGEDVRTIRQELEGVNAGHVALSEGLKQRVAETRAEAEKRVNDQYVAQVMREELMRLGYSVGTDFGTLFAEGGKSTIPHPEQAEYAVQMQVDTSRGILDVAVVRFADSLAVPEAERRIRDNEAETRWCRDFDNLQSKIRARGVKGRIVRRLPPGAKPVEITQISRTEGSRRPKAIDQQRRER